MANPEKWHQRFVQQARWTESVRRFLFQQAGLEHARGLLEVGCGTGAILGEIAHQTGARLVGIDIQQDYLHFAHSHGIAAAYAAADALHLPFADGVFSITCCHFFLLWVEHPLQALLEMKRVTAPGGYVLAMAEPDYGGRIDHPAALGELGRRQGQSLSHHGADPLVGRKLKSFIHKAGLRMVQAGVLGGQWSEPPTQLEWESEWDTLESDLSGEISTAELAELKRLDFSAWRKGERILYVPTFYAWGQVNPTP